MKSQSVDLAISNVRAQLTYKTRSIKIKIGDTEVERSLYLLPIKHSGEYYLALFL